MHGRLLSGCCAILAALTILTNCSGAPAGSETEAEKFRQLGRVLPTASTADTMQTRREVGLFRALFIELCPETACKKG